MHNRITPNTEFFVLNDDESKNNDGENDNHEDTPIVAKKKQKTLQCSENNSVRMRNSGNMV